MSIECPVCHEDAHFYCLAQGTIAAVLYSANEDGEQDYEIDGELEELQDLSNALNVVPRLTPYVKLHKAKQKGRRNNMKIAIRPNTFETNSSSVHSIVIISPEDWNEIRENDMVYMNSDYAHFTKGNLYPKDGERKKRNLWQICQIGMTLGAWTDCVPAIMSMKSTHLPHPKARTSSHYAISVMTDKHLTPT